MASQSTHSPSVRRNAALAVWVVNLAFGVVIGVNYLAHVPDVDSIKVWLFALPALVSSVLFLTLLPGLGFIVAAHFLRSTRVLGFLQAFFWTVFHVLLYADTRIFNLFKYHFNGQVLNLVYTRGSEDAIHLGWQVWTTVSCGLFAMGVLETLLWRRALKRAHLEWSFVLERRRFLRPALLFGAVIVPAVFVEKTIYATSDYENDQEVTALARLFPLYARVPMKDFASKVLGDQDVVIPPRVEVDGFELDYPHTMPDVDPDGPRPNVLVIVIDCLRGDMISPETTPFIHEWSKDSRRFQDHVSGGNSTRYGLFSLIYGLHGSYWFSFLQEGRSPVMIDVLDEAGYEFGIFSSASQNYPELRETAWSRIAEDVHDDYGEIEPWKRDELSSADLIHWLRERSTADDPFFGFILLDAPHQTYSHPPDRKPFEPGADELDYMAMTANEGPEPEELERVRNRYKNAVHFSDEVAGRILAAVEENGLAEDTLVIVTGDHGEEFRECGFFGHTCAFTPEQVEVPFLMKGAGVEPGIETGPTSHMDFPATVIEMIGGDATVRAQWTLGGNLFAPDPERRRVISGWNELGVWTPNAILRVPLSVMEFDVEIYDYRWNLLVDGHEVFEAEESTLIELGAECNRFLRSP